MAAAPAARADDELDKFVAQNRIVAQKVKSEAASAIAQSRTLEKTDPDQAQALLQKALRQVQNSTALPAAEQTQLTSQLLGRLREVGEVARQQKVVQQQIPLRELPKKPASVDPGKGPSAIAQQVIENTGAAVDSSARVNREKAKGYNSVVSGLGAGSIPPEGDIAFPKDWAAKTKMRAGYAGPKLSDKEIALVKALNSVMSVEFNETPLKSALELIQERTGQSIIVEPASLKEANIEYANETVTFKANKAAVSTILRVILRNSGLTYVIKEGTLQVVTPARAREMMVVRTYPISDLVATNDLAQQFGPFVARAQMLINVQNLINSIQSTVDPSIWQANGGGGSIQFFEPGMALIIRAPAEFHYQFAGVGR
jgi:hypothetical protein